MTSIYILRISSFYSVHIHTYIYGYMQYNSINKLINITFHFFGVSVTSSMRVPFRFIRNGSINHLNWFDTVHTSIECRTSKPPKESFLPRLSIHTRTHTTGCLSVFNQIYILSSVTAFPWSNISYSPVLSPAQHFPVITIWLRISRQFSKKIRFIKNTYLLTAWAVTRQTESTYELDFLESV